MVSMTAGTGPQPEADEATRHEHRMVPTAHHGKAIGGRCADATKTAGSAKRTSPARPAPTRKSTLTHSTPRCGRSSTKAFFAADVARSALDVPVVGSR